MLNISWPMSAERLVSRGVCVGSRPVAAYRDRQSVEGSRDVIGPFCDDHRLFAATSHSTPAHLTVNPLVPRPRAKHG